MVNKSLIGPVSTLVGTVIGAGVLGLPYVFAKAGFLLGFVNLLILAGVIILMNLMVGEVSLRTKKFYQLAGLANKYLGNRGKWLMMIAMMIGIWGAMIAYIIGEGESLAAITGSLNPFFWSIIFFAVASAIVFFGLKAVEKSEVFLAIGVVAIIVIVSLASVFKIDLSNLTTISWSSAFMPYGVVLFALLGTAAIPEMRQELSNNRKSLWKSILIGSAIPAAVYALFAFVSVGVMGARTTEVATIGLGKFLGEHIVIMGNVFAIFAMASSFLVLALALKDAFHKDVRLNKYLSFCLVVFMPLFLFLIGVKSFVGVLGISGALAGGLDGILIALMWRKAKRHGDRKPEYSVKFKWAPWLLIIIFTGGIIYTLVDLII